MKGEDAAAIARQGLEVRTYFVRGRNALVARADFAEMYVDYYLHQGQNGYQHAPTPSGWPAHRLEDYIAQSTAFESQLLSFLAEGVFQKFPKLKLVLIESGFTWLPTLLWRTNKTWRGVRPEVPWIERPPAEILRERVRLTLQPVDAPRGDPQLLTRTLVHIGADRMLLFSTDYPHWHFDGDDAIPEGFSPDLIRKIAIDNPYATYHRITKPLAVNPVATELSA